MMIGSTLIDSCSVGDLRLRSPNPLDGRFQFSLTANSMPTTLEPTFRTLKSVDRKLFPETAIDMYRY
jgi:hypothetical protein